MLDQVYTVCRRRHFSRKTEQAYRYSIRQFIDFHGKQHPATLGTTEVEVFLNHLAVARRVSASTQSQALNTLAFLYGQVLDQPLGTMAAPTLVSHRAALFEREFIRHANLYGSLAGCSHPAWSRRAAALRLPPSSQRSALFA
ncbi:site-specific integrase [Chitinolyticbacter albus]|uniref:site-specific integrase n=1 Tax=Chitinolyticbacter albus TaxID=2961951 RepID=UPI0021093CBF|nr:site-specific integrase [Chitinolyticbacter albus]